MKKAAWTTLAAVAASIAAALPTAHAQTNYYEKPAQTLGVDVEEHIGRTLPMELEFTDSDGKKVTLGEYFKANDKPAVILLVYYDCPVVCDVLMSKQAETFGDLDYTVGKDFRALVFSFDPSETPQRAAEVKSLYTSGYKRRDEPGVREGWAFHVSDQETSKALADAIGFRYRPMTDGNFSHPIAQFIITPDGKISRYLYGYYQEPRDMKLALMEASQGKLVNTIGDRLLDFCYLFDPNAGKYTLRAMRVMQLGGAVTVLGLGTLIGALFVGERVRRRARGVAPASGPCDAGINETRAGSPCHTDSHEDKSDLA